MTKTEDAFRHWVGIGMASAAKREACERGRSDDNEVGQHRRTHCAQQPQQPQWWQLVKAADVADAHIDGGHDEEDAGGEGKEDDHHQDDVD